MGQITNPTTEKIIKYNLIILNIIKVKKADKPEVLSHHRIVEIIDGCENLKGDIYDKAVYLLKGLIQKHPFASGNRRTAFLVTKEFVLENRARFGIKDDPKQAKIMLGIREDFYTDLEIKDWIKNGKIKEFKR